MVEHKLVDCLVTTAGGVEEDLIKCLAPTYLGDWYLRGKDLRMKGLNRIGNLIVPNDNYCKFEDWVMPILNTMLEEQNKKVPIFIIFIIVSSNLNMLISIFFCYNTERKLT